MRRTLLTLILTAMLASSGCVAPAGPWRTVLDNPTKPHYTLCVDYAVFDAGRYLRDIDVLFRGEVKSARDVQVSWKNSEDRQTDAYLSVKEIAVKDVLYGELPLRDTVRAIGNVSWENGELDVWLEIGKEYYFLADVYDETERQTQQSYSDNQLHPYELGDMWLSGTAYCAMPVSDGVVSYWSEWPLEGVTLPTEHPTSRSQGTTTMPRREFERKLLALVRQYKGEATEAPAATN